jgi:hypothetical protein
MNSMMREKGNVLDPLLVWWSGKRWLVIDGHHRLEAYRRLKEQGKGAKSIPVKVFEGTPVEAHLESIEGNRKNKLNMSNDDKATNAWKIIVLDYDMTYSQIRDKTGVSKGTITNMNNKKRELQSKYGDDWVSMVDGRSWKDVLRLGNHRDFNEVAQNKLKGKFLEGFRKQFGKTPAKHPETFTEALIEYSEPTAKGVLYELIDMYLEEAKELIEAHERDRELFDEHGDF